MTAIENSVKEAGARKWETPLARMESTYENIPRDVLRRTHPIQSISVFMRFRMMEKDWGCETLSAGIPKMEMMEMMKVKTAPI